MPWNWQGRGQESAEQGGSRGTYNEAAVAHAWPKYEAEYLANRLATAEGKYKLPDGLGKANEAAKQQVYFDKVSEDYKAEADECLKKEFSNWLQGTHDDNVNPHTYANLPGLPVRKAVFREAGKNGTGLTEVPGHQLNAAWKPTWWGEQQLTHLPGVRDYLRNMQEYSNEADFKMNMLAELGPQDLESAWVYFKHWVKGRPVAPDICMHIGESRHMPPPADGFMPPADMQSWRASQPVVLKPPAMFDHRMSDKVVADVLEDAEMKDTNEADTSVLQEMVIDQLIATNPTSNQIALDEAKNKTAEAAQDLETERFLAEAQLALGKALEAERIAKNKAEEIALIDKQRAAQKEKDRKNVLKRAYEEAEDDFAAAQAAPLPDDLGVMPGDWIDDDETDTEGFGAAPMRTEEDVLLPDEQELFELSGMYFQATEDEIKTLAEDPLLKDRQARRAMRVNLKEQILRRRLDLRKKALPPPYPKWVRSKNRDERMRRNLVQSHREAATAYLNKMQANLKENDDEGAKYNWEQASKIVLDFPKRSGKPIKNVWKSWILPDEAEDGVAKKQAVEDVSAD